MGDKFSEIARKYRKDTTGKDKARVSPDDPVLDRGTRIDRDIEFFEGKEHAGRKNRERANTARAVADRAGEMADRGEEGSNAPVFFDDRPSRAKRARSKRMYDGR